MSKFTLKAIMAASVLFVGANAASAGTDAVRAEAFFNAISGGNPETVSSFYADKAEFHWVGGPLAGIYKGKAQIKGVWEKFGSAAGQLTYKTLELSESNNGPVSTVTARVNFIGPKEVPVKFILMFKDGKIVNQIWQVDRGETYTAAKAPTKGPAPVVPARAERPDAPNAEPQQDATPQGAPAQDDPSEVAAVEEGVDGAPAPEAANDPQADEAKAPPPAPTQAAPEAPTPPPGLAGPGEGAPAKKFVKKAEKKAKREYGYGYGYDEDGYHQGYWEPRGRHHRRRFHGGYGHGHGGY
jgi:hypothetical protein